MNLSEMSKELDKLVEAGHGKLEVYAVNAETGEAMVLRDPCVDEVPEPDEEEPYPGPKLKPGTMYVSVYGE